MRGIWVVAVATLAVCCASVPGPASATFGSREPILAADSVTSAADALAQEVRDAVRASGGDLDAQQVHLVLGFSTGHFGNDPLRARAAREIATALLRQLPVVSGDAVRVYAYEMGTWRYAEAAGVDQHLQGSQRADTDAFSHLMPLTSRAESTGGHDTERAIAEIGLDLLRDRETPPQDFIIVLLANDAASVSPDTPGERIWGQDNPRYLDALRSLRAERMPAVNRSGASLVLTFRATLPEGEEVERDLHAVIVKPVVFAAASLSQPRPAPEAQVSDAQVEAPLTQERSRTQDERGESSWGLLVLLALVALVIGLAIRRVIHGGPSEPILNVAGTRFPLKGIAAGEEICHLAGSGFPDATNKTVIVIDSKPLPPIVLARVRKKGGLVVVQGEGDTRVTAVNDAAVGTDAIVRKSEKQKVSFISRWAEKPHLPPREFAFDVEIAFEPG